MSKSAEQIRSAARPFGLPLISQLKNAMTVYPSKFNPAEKSVKMLEVTVPVESCGMLVTSTIYGRIKPTNSGHEYIVGASIPKNVVFESDEQREAFIEHAEAAAIRSAGWDKLYAKAEALLTGVKAPDAKPDRPRLVKNVTIGVTKPLEAAQNA
jgi:hypothetical protein